MTEIVEMSGTPIANRPSKKPVICLIMATTFFRYAKSNHMLDAPIWPHWHSWNWWRIASYEVHYIVVEVEGDVDVRTSTMILVVLGCKVWSNKINKVILRAVKIQFGPASFVLSASTHAGAAFAVFTTSNVNVWPFEVANIFRECFWNRIFFFQKVVYLLVSILLLITVDPLRFLDMIMRRYEDELWRDVFTQNHPPSWFEYCHLVGLRLAIAGQYGSKWIWKKAECWICLGYIASYLQHALYLSVRADRALTWAASIPLKSTV